VFSPDGKRIASAGKDRTIRIWDAAHGKELHILEGHADGVFCLVFSPDGSRLASCGVENDRTIRIWDTHSYRLMPTMMRHEEAVYAVAFSPDGGELASACKDRKVRLWDPVTGDLRLVLSGHADWVYSIAFTPDGESLLSGSKDNTVRVWRSGPRESAGGDRETTGDLAPRMAHGLFQGEVPIIAQKDCVVGQPFDLQEKRVFDMKLLPHGDGLLFSTTHGHGYLWARFSDTDARRLSADHIHIRDFEVSPCGTQAASAIRAAGNNPGRIAIWNVETQRLLHHLDIQEHSWALQYSPDGSYLLAAGIGPALLLLDARSLKPVKTVQLEGRVYRAKLSRDGKLMACSTESDPSVVTVWDMVKLEVVAEWTHSGHVTHLTFSPDGKTLAVASNDSSKSVFLWDCQSRCEVRSISGHAQSVVSVEFLSHGTRLITCSSDGTVRIWDVATGRQVASLEGEGPRYLTLSPDAKRLATVRHFHGENEILMWDVDRILCELGGYE
jgi:WD40 repeat protein